MLSPLGNAKRWLTVSHLLFLSFAVAPIPSAKGVTYHVGMNAGLFQQPTSHYYHLYYGGYAEVARDDRSLMGRAYYLERPAFSSNGFTDQEAGSFLFVGTKLSGAKRHGLYGMLGGGQMQGYVKDAASRDTRRYNIAGFAALVEYAFHWQHVEIAVAHQSFTGLVSKEEVEAYVGWPFNFFALSLGTAF